MKGADPLFLKVVLSELRVFGSFQHLPQKIHDDFGDSPVTAFHGVLGRLEKDPLIPLSYLSMPYRFFLVFFPMHAMVYQWMSFQGFSYRLLPWRIMPQVTSRLLRP